LDRHRAEASLHRHAVSRRLHAAFGDVKSNAACVRELNHEIVEHRVALLDKLERSD
jgi:hypothetical protein